jgi:hypothetical protein
MRAAAKSVAARIALVAPGMIPAMARSPGGWTERAGLWVRHRRPAGRPDAGCHHVRLRIPKWRLQAAVRQERTRRDHTSDSPIPDMADHGADTATGLGLLTEAVNAGVIGPVAWIGSCGARR